MLLWVFLKQRARMVIPMLTWTSQDFQWGAGMTRSYLPDWKNKKKSKLLLEALAETISHSLHECGTMVF